VWIRGVGCTAGGLCPWTGPGKRGEAASAVVPRPGSAASRSQKGVRGRCRTAPRVGDLSAPRRVSSRGSPQVYPRWVRRTVIGRSPAPGSWVVILSQCGRHTHGGSAGDDPGARNDRDRGLLARACPAATLGRGHLLCPLLRESTPARPRRAQTSPATHRVFSKETLPILSRPRTRRTAPPTNRLFFNQFPGVLWERRWSSGSFTSSSGRPA
jgi:hypothetical protein